MVQTSEVWGGHDTANGLHSTRRWLSVPKTRFCNNGDEARRRRAQIRCGPRATATAANDIPAVSGRTEAGTEGFPQALGPLPLCADEEVDQQDEETAYNGTDHCDAGASLDYLEGLALAWLMTTALSPSS
jgi:hypothetical protein